MINRMVEQIWSVAVIFLCLCLGVLIIWGSVWAFIKLNDKLEAQNQAHVEVSKCIDNMMDKIDRLDAAGKSTADSTVAKVEKAINCLANPSMSISDKEKLQWILGLYCRPLAQADVGMLLDVDASGAHPLTEKEVKKVHALARELKQHDVACPDIHPDPRDDTYLVNAYVLFCWSILVVVLVFLGVKIIKKRRAR